MGRTQTKREFQSNIELHVAALRLRSSESTRRSAHYTYPGGRYQGSPDALREREQRMRIILNSPRFLLSLGLFLMLLGIVLPFLMVIKVLESTFFLNFFAWGASVAGLSFGTIGFAMLSTRRKK